MFDPERLIRWILGPSASRRSSVEVPTAVVLATWPAGGRRTLIEQVATLDGVLACRSLDALVAASSPTSPSTSDPEPTSPVPVWVSRGRPNLGVSPVRVISGEILRLDRLEMRAALIDQGLGLDTLDALARVSEGWIGPFRRLLGETDPEAAVATDAFRQWVEASIYGPLPAETAAVLDQIVSVHAIDQPVDLDLWRRRLFDRPERLAAFEALRHRWGLLVPTPVGLCLPRVLLLGRPPARTVAAPHQRALASAALALDRPAQAADWLRRADDPAAARRVDALAGRLEIPGAIDLRLLGPPGISRIGPDGIARELDWRLRRAFQLVAFLALAPGRRATRDDLIAHCFPDASRGSVGRNFHPTISDARRTLGVVGSVRGGILHQDGIYRLDPSVRWGVDCDRFVAAVERSERQPTISSEGHLGERPAGERGPGERASYEGALLDCALDAWRLYRGPLLDGHDAAWITDARDRLHHRYLGVLRRIGDLAGRLDRPTLALDALRTVLVHEPFEESAHLRVMELYARQGRRDLVRRQFVRLQELLKELGVGPADDTVVRYHALMG